MNIPILISIFILILLYSFKLYKLLLLLVNYFKINSRDNYDVTNKKVYINKTKKSYQFKVIK